MRVEPIRTDRVADLAAAVGAAVSGTGPALGLGATGDAVLEAPEGTAVVVTTSGSTGVPKSVVLSGAALRASAEATLARLGTGSWMLALPASYVAGLQVVVRSVVQGAVPTALEGRFSPRSFAEAALMMSARERRFTSLVPAQLATLLDAAEGDHAVAAALRSFDAVLIGGQALAPALRERAADAGVRVVRTYGSTETCGGCVYDGVPLDGVRLAVRDGEIRLGGPTLATGYLGDPELTARVFERDASGDRWFRTGDAGILDDGVLRVRGRIDNVIVSGGVNVSLDRVEGVVRSVRGLDQAVVVGVPDERWGEASVIVAVRGEALRRSESDQLDAARSAVAAAIGVEARPSRLVLVDELELLPSGKPDRERIRAAVVALR